MRVANCVRAMAVLTESASGRLVTYLLPGGAPAAHGVRGVRTKQRGQIRSSFGARWMPFEAEEFIDATCSHFRWDARMGSHLLTSVRATDAYEDGHGYLIVKKGPIRIMHVEGPDPDKGELQRYLAYVASCPAMLINNHALTLTDDGADTVRVQDAHADADTWVDVHIAADGAPLVMRAVRPMLVGTKAVPTPWFATGSHPAVHEGLRLWHSVEASWHPPAGAFTYIRVELTSVEIVR